jgi:hypothetical protein
MTKFRTRAQVFVWLLISLTAWISAEEHWYEGQWIVDEELSEGSKNISSKGMVQKMSRMLYEIGNGQISIMKIKASVDMEEVLVSGNGFHSKDGLFRQTYEVKAVVLKNDRVIFEANNHQRMRFALSKFENGVRWSMSGRKDLRGLRWKKIDRGSRHHVKEGFAVLIPK